jgi:hypothetical protein
VAPSSARSATSGWTSVEREPRATLTSASSLVAKSTSNTVVLIEFDFEGESVSRLGTPSAHRHS